MYDDGGPNGSYSTSSEHAYTIDVGTGVVVLDVTSLSLESGYDELWLCDLTATPGAVGAQCQQITSTGQYHSDTSQATVFMDSDISVTYAGFALNWSQGFLGCTDSTACAGYDASATILDLSACSYSDALGVCGGTCL